MAANTSSVDALKFPILIGDIGGTNARFSILRDAFAEPKTFPIVQTSDHETIDDAIQSSVLDKTSIQPKTAVLAVAGPIDGDAIELTNCPWVVRPPNMLSGLGLDDIILMNDFEAQALAISSLSEASRTKIGGGDPIEGASRAVLGPGTGLGVAGLIRARTMWIPVAGEGGHMDLGPRTDRDVAIWQHLDRIEGRVSAEQVLCGRGLVNLYRRSPRSRTPRPSTPPRRRLPTAPSTTRMPCRKKPSTSSPPISAASPATSHCSSWPEAASSSAAASSSG